MTQHEDHDPGVADFEPDVRDLVAELFPVEVALPDGRVVSRAKVFVLSGGVVVYGEDGRAPVQMFSARHAGEPQLANPAAPKRRQHSVITTTEGELHVNGVLGCGCGSPLKSFTYAHLMAR